MTDVKPPEFTVDTGLFRQLGELLVGRDSTALVELIKNAYDADATSVLLYGENLDTPDAAVLQLVDDGTGMTDAQFRSGFLRLAARGKTVGDRRSPVFLRRFTGEKGVGRLAAHKLAALLEVKSVAAVGLDGSALTVLRDAHPNLSSGDLRARIGEAQHTLVQATIDWDLIEQADTLSDIHRGLELAAELLSRRTAAGTTLRLTRLRHAWTVQDLQDLGRQLTNFEPPGTLATTLSRSVLPGPLLFKEPRIRDADRSDPGMKLEVQGDFARPEEYWAQVERSADWVLEIRAARGRDVRYALAPTRAGLAENQYGTPLAAVAPHAAPQLGPFFDARILLRSGTVPTLERAWSTLNSGVRIYLEGFRVLPYGEIGNDWLGLDFDYTRRAGRFQINPLLGGPEDDLAALRALTARDVSLRLQPNRNYFGAVFLTESGAGGLRTLVNREGFVPDENYDRLVATVRTGIDLLQRAWALASYTQKTELATEARRTRAQVEYDALNENEGMSDAVADSEIDADKATDADKGGEDGGDNLVGDEWTVVGKAVAQGTAAQLRNNLALLRRRLSLPPRSKDELESERPRPVVGISAIDRAVVAVEDAADALIQDASLLRVLASVGAQMSAFTHEIAQLVPATRDAEQALEPVAEERWPSKAVHARRAVAEVRRALERQASYLVDVASSEGRRRRTRLDLRGRVGVALLGFVGTAAARDIELLNNIPEDLRTPPVFRSELQAIMTNLLSNAIKAAGPHGRVAVDGEETGHGVRILVQNTGVRVEPSEAERWFVPYASTTTILDPVLGQGMGLGLPITRDMVSEYGGTVRFIAPGPGFATAVEVVIPE